MTPRRSRARAGGATGPPEASPANLPTVEVGQALLDNLQWRLVGPFRGGRVVAVAGDPRDYLTFYFGSTGGGVWKTTDAGASWTNVSDGFFQRASVGAIAVAASDPNVIYAGMGECCIRANVSHGDGVYRSVDAGLSWSHCGLAATRHIGRIRVDPRDPERVFVAALGHAHGPNPERGLYRSEDGGRSWELILHRSSDAGAVDVVMDTSNPRILYASFWEARRLPWRIESGGPGSGVWRSTDGGDSWEELSRRPGLPSGPLGRIGITTSAKPGRLWAIVQAQDGAVYRSDDYGDHWTRMSTQPELRFRPWYFHHICADPVDPETVWVLNIGTWRSHDGGQTFASVSVPHGDTHDLWFDPSNSRRLILGGDGGGNVSLDGGISWSTCYNQPTAELYHVTTDDRQPYRIYASQQDSSTICLPSHSEVGAITMADSYAVAGGESGHVVVRADNPDIVFGGSYRGWLTRYDHATRSASWVAVWPELTWATAREVRHRFNWTAPLAASPHDARILYHAANRVFRSDDEGATWTPISPDLTRNDPDKLTSSGGATTPDDSGADYYCTLFALAESPVQAGVIWAGSDDGLIHLTRDGGENWTDVTPPDLAPWGTVSCIEPSHYNVGTAYVAVERHKLDDFSPYLWRTNDFGASWQRIDIGIPDGEFCHVVREDPSNPSWLYCGTEAGVHASADRGVHWMSIRGALPRVPVHDLTIRHDDLVAATHGRSIWILDDLPTLRQFTKAQAAPLETPFVFDPRRFVAFTTRELFRTPPKLGRSYVNLETVILTCDTRLLPGTENVMTTLADAGANRPNGVVVLFWVPTAVTEGCSLSFSDSDGRLIRTFASRPPSGDVVQADLPSVAAVGNGLNRLLWDTRHEPNSWARTRLFKRADRRGPRVVPGRYLVTVSWPGGSTSKEFEIAPDPRSRQSTADRVAQYALTTHLWNRIGDLDRACDYVEEVCTTAGRWLNPTQTDINSDEIRAHAESLQARLRAIEGRLVTLNPEPPMDKPARTLDGKLLTLLEVADNPSGAAASTFAAADELSDQLETNLQELDSVVDGELADLNALVARLGEPAMPVLKMAAAPTQSRAT